MFCVSSCVWQPRDCTEDFIVAYDDPYLYCRHGKKREQTCRYLTSCLVDCCNSANNHDNNITGAHKDRCAYVAYFRVYRDGKYSFARPAMCCIDVETTIARTHMLFHWG